MTALIEYDDVTKRFPGVVALDRVRFGVAAGEVRALIGENGAGKSTLLKILAGEYAPDGGTVRVDGVPQRFRSPRDSQAAGIAIIHQELHLAPDLSVAENLMLGALPTRYGRIDRAQMHARAQAVLARLGEAIDPDARVRTLSIGQRQMIEIGRALLRDARIIAFDEPTSSLSARETGRLMQIIRELRAAGCAILYVSHRMEEVFALADSATVLRDGTHVCDRAPVSAADEPALIAAMAGRKVADIYSYRPRTAGDVRLRAEAVIGPRLRAPVSIEVRAGEIVGLFGLVGAGRTELLRLIFGADRPRAGRIEADGITLSPGDPRAAIAAGIALVPEDRKDQGIVPAAAVRENIALAWRNLAGAPRLVDAGRERTATDALIRRLRVKTPDGERAIATLSGGNQQKAILARCLMAGASVLLLDEPTRGIDVAARSELYDQLFAFAEAGGAICFASSDLAEVLGIADRVLVMRDGAVAGAVARPDFTPERVLRLALPPSPRSSEEALSA